MNDCWGPVLLSGLLLAIGPLPTSAQGVLSDNQTLHAVEHGAGRVTIIVLHGGPGVSHQYLRPEWDTLGRRHRMVFYDQRGCGRSLRRGPYHWEQHVADLHTLVVHYRSQGPVVLAGSSWGSWLALLYAWRHPHQAAALVLSGLPPWPIRAQMDDEIPARPFAPRSLDDSLPENVRERLAVLDAANQAYQDALRAWAEARQDSLEAGLLPQPTWDSLASIRFASNLDPRLAARIGESCPAARHGAHSSLRRGPSLQDLRAVTTPVLIVRGTRPNAVGDGAAGLMRVLPRRMLVTLMGAGHDPWYERPRQFFAHVERFLTRASVVPVS